MKIGQLSAFEGRIGLQFDQEPRLARMREIHAELEALLSGTGDRARIDVLVADFAVLKGEQVIPEPVVEAPLVLVERETIPVPPPRIEQPGSLVEAWAVKSKPVELQPIPKRTVARPVQLSFF